MTCGNLWKQKNEIFFRENKHDPRLTTSGKIVKFSLDGIDFAAEPKDFFYNWIYSVALYQHPKEIAKLKDYNAFTDIEFNPEKSINCQARTVAIVKGLHEAGLLDEAMKSPREYLRIVYATACKGCCCSDSII